MKQEISQKGDPQLQVLLRKVPNGFKIHSKGVSVIYLYTQDFENARNMKTD